MKESVLSFEEKKHILGLSTFKFSTSTYNYFTTNTLNIIFDDFSTWLIGYRTEFSCLYLLQGHNFISIVWLGRTDEYGFFSSICTMRWYFDPPNIYIYIYIYLCFKIHKIKVLHILHLYWVKLIMWWAIYVSIVWPFDS